MTNPAGLPMGSSVLRSHGNVGSSQRTPWLLTDGPFYWAWLWKLQSTGGVSALHG
ncbi:3148_t:CDS:2 [Ambispora gerdemannii]|uniref:3148_t:CDS:1 n=1 Tax=Ambispora gerdemannii TaxID=144530 RepID=A0A9N9DAD2_9GLOM|nr:3148_t:CDS:2 [Ambispora gerdemannii]